MIQILMSTYNGEKYLKEQIESLLNQTYQKFKILIRDDGSTDKTKDILESYQKKYPSIIKCVYGENLGVVKSFIKLINLSDEKCDYFAFCDQDDYWLEEKLEKAFEKMRKDIPFLYFSNKILVDEKLRILKIENKDIEVKKFNSLIENLATGCTIVINKKLIRYLKNKNINSKNILMHDWFAYILANFLGEVYFDKNSYIYYRQHSNNVVGSESNAVKKNYKRVIRFLTRRKKDSLKNQIIEILKVMNKKNEEIKKIVYAKTIIDKFLLMKKLKRQTVLDTYIFRILYIFGWF